MLVGAIVGIVFEVGVICVLGYAALRFATRFTDMRRELEQLKIAVRELQQRA